MINLKSQSNEGEPSISQDDFDFTLIQETDFEPRPGPSNVNQNFQMFSQEDFDFNLTQTQDTIPNFDLSQELPPEPLVSTPKFG